MDDQEIIARFFARDEEGLTAARARYEPYCAAVARSLLNDPRDQEECLSDTWLRAWNAIPPQRPRSLGAFLAKITRNLAISRLREHGRTEPLVQEDWQDRLADNPAVTHEDRMMLEAVLSALSDEERQIVTLHALTGLRHREIAALLGLPLPTVLSKYSRALKKLQLAWKEAD